MSRPGLSPFHNTETYNSDSTVYHGFIYTKPIRETSATQEPVYGSVESTSSVTQGPDIQSQQSTNTPNTPNKEFTHSQLTQGSENNGEDNDPEIQDEIPGNELLTKNQNGGSRDSVFLYTKPVRIPIKVNEEEKPENANSTIESNEDSLEHKGVPGSSIFVYTKPNRGAHEPDQNVEENDTAEIITPDEDFNYLKEDNMEPEANFQTTETRRTTEESKMTTIISTDQANIITAEKISTTQQEFTGKLLSS